MVASFDKCGCTSHSPEHIDHLSKAERNKELANLSKGLAHTARIEIIKILANMPPDRQCICGDIVNALPLAQSSVSQHLKILKETGWIQGEIDGPRVCYCIVKGILDYYHSLLKTSILEVN